MPIKFYTDTHIAKAIVEQLRARGVDIIHCHEAGRNEASDLEHLEYAAGEGRSIVTNDQRFRVWHEQWLEAGKHHAGIFIITKQKDNIGMVVGELLYWHEMIDGGAGTLESDIYDQVFLIP
jgi:predicted nuclease of predicted toxin-antitoxin system